MVETLGGWPFLELTFANDGTVDADQLAALKTALANLTPTPTDLIVLSHGWNNDSQFATELYKSLLTNMATLGRDLHSGTLGDRTFLVVGVYWRSIKWADETLIPQTGSRRFAAGLGNNDVSVAEVQKLIERLAGFVSADPGDVDTAMNSVANLDSDVAARNVFIKSLQAMVPSPSHDSQDDNSERFLAGDGRLLDQLVATLTVSSPRAEGVATSLGRGVEAPVPEADVVAAGLANGFSGMRAAAWRLLNYTTYYTMKERAGVVGSGLGRVLARLRERAPALKIHLAGHSFGARLVTAAIREKSFGPSSLTLLQGAFSHSGFSATVPKGGVGYFRNVIAENRVQGPIIVTHTKNDRAVGIAYAIASRISGVGASAFGDPSDPYGGIGRNGAVNMGRGEADYIEMADAPHSYPLLPAGRVTNLKADRYVAGHGDVTNRAVANVVLSAMR